MKENDPLKKSLTKAVSAAMENIAFEEPEVLSESVDITGETITFSLRVVSPYLLQTRIVVPKELVAYTKDEKAVELVRELLSSTHVLYIPIKASRISGLASATSVVSLISFCRS